MDKRYCQNEGRGYCGECVSGDLRDKISGLQDEAKKAHAAGKQEGLAEGEANHKAFRDGCEKNISDAKRLNQQMYYAIQKMAIRLEEAESKLAAMTAKVEEARAEAFREVAKQMDKCRLSAQETAKQHTGEYATKYIGKAEALWAAREYCEVKALSPEPEKPAPEVKP